MTYLRNLLFLLAGTGLATSAVIHLLSWLDIFHVDVVVTFVLIAGAFIGWLPANKIAQSAFGRKRSWVSWRDQRRWLPRWMTVGLVVLMIYVAINFFAAALFISSSQNTDGADQIHWVRLASGHTLAFYAFSLTLLYATNRAEAARAAAAPLMPLDEARDDAVAAALSVRAAVAPAPARQSITPRFLSNLAVRVLPYRRRLIALSYLSLFGFFFLIVYTFAALQNDFFFLLSLIGWLFGFTWPVALAGIASFRPDNETFLLRPATTQQDKLANARAFISFGFNVVITLFWFLFPIVVLPLIYLQASRA